MVFRGIPTVIDEERVTNFEKALEGSGVKVIDKQYANWNRDDAFKVMQDFLSKHPKIDAVWASDDDMALGVMEAIRQAKREDIKFVLGGAGMKDMVKRVMDGDKMIPVNVSYPPAMIATAMGVTAAHFYTNAPDARHLRAQRAADHQGQRQGALLPELAVLSDVALAPSCREGRGQRQAARSGGRLPLAGFPPSLTPTLGSSPMKTMKGPALFLAQFAGDEAPFNSLDAICRWAASLGYKGVQIPTWDARLFDLKKAADSDAYCDEVKGIVRGHGLEITELSTHLQGQLVAVHPAFDEAFDGFAAPEVRGKPQARRNGRSTRCGWRRRPRSASA